MKLTVDTTVPMNLDNVVRGVVATAKNHHYLLLVAGSPDEAERYDEVVAYYHGKAVERLMDSKGVKRLTELDHVSGFLRNHSATGVMVPIDSDERERFASVLGTDDAAPCRFFWLFWEVGGWEGEAFTAQDFRDGSFKDVPLL